MDNRIFDADLRFSSRIVSERAARTGVHMGYLSRVRKFISCGPLGPAARGIKRVVSRPTPKPLPENDDTLAFKVLKSVLRHGGNGVDIGAHKGDFLREIIAASPNGHHYAIEAIPQLSASLAQNFPNVTVKSAACSSGSGWVEFAHFVDLPFFSGIRARTDVPAGQRKELIRVETLRLDDLLPSDLPIHLIKIDVEGAELGVLQGARRTLTTYRPCVIFEHGKGGIELYETTPAMVYDFFAECGMRIRTVVSLMDNSAPFTRDEFIAAVELGEIFNFVATAE